MDLNTVEVAESNDTVDRAFGSTLGEVVLLGYPYSKTIVAGGFRKLAIAFTPKLYEDHFYFSGQYFAFNAKWEWVSRHRPAGRVGTYSSAPLVPIGGAWRTPFPPGTLL